MRPNNIKKTAIMIGLLGATGMASAAQVIATDLIVQGSECVGIDCVNGESFGFDTIRLKENNLRIKAQDTSASASFPSVDWQITFNESGNGGANKFSVDNVDAGTTPFTIRSGAGNNAIYVDDQGDVGLNTSTPVVELHIADGDSPTVRLEQNGSSGFTPQTWDLAGNETNFFVRNVTTSSHLPFRILAGSGTDDAIVIAGDGDVGLGTDGPSGNLHLRHTGTVLTYLESSDGNPTQLRLRSDSDNRRLIAVNNADVAESQIALESGTIILAGATTSANVYATFNATGLTVNGSISTTASGLLHPDYVFEKDYALMPLTELNDFVSKNKHLPEIPSAAEVSKNGINISELQITLLKKVEELTLYTIKQQETINKLEKKLENTKL